MGLNRAVLKKLSLLFAACVVVAVAVGCGSSSSDSSSSSSTAAKGNEPEGTPVKIGMIAPQGTPAYNYVNEIAAVKSGVAALNARGGLKGHPVELIYCNDKGDPNQTTSCGREMVNEGVIAMVGGGVLNGNLLPPILAEGNISSIGTNAITGPELNAPSYFLFTAGTSVGYAVVSAYAGSVGMPASFFGADNPTSQALWGADEEAAKEAGTPFVAVVPVAPDQSDFAPVVAAGKPDEAEGAVLFLGTEQAAQLVQAANSSGADFTYLFEEEPDETLSNAFGGPISKMVYTTPFPSFDSGNAKIEQYKEELKAGAEEGISSAQSALEYPGFPALESWLAVEVIEQFVEEGKIKELTADSVTKALKATKDADIGLLKSWSPNEEGPEGISRASNVAYNLIAIKEGKEEQLTEEPVTVEELVNGDVKLENPFAK